MKKAKITTIALSVFMALNSLFLLPANASTPDDFHEENFADCIKLEDFEWLDSISYIDSMYLDTKDDESVTIYNVMRNPDIIYFTASFGTNGFELAERIQSVDKNLILDGGRQVINGKYTFFITMKDEQGKYGRISSKLAKELFQSLSDVAESFDYKFDQYVYTYTVYNYMTAYDSFDYDFSVEDKLRDYIEVNNLKAEIIKYAEGDTDVTGNTVYNDMIFVIPSEKLTPVEHYEFAKKIAEATGIRPHGVSPTGIDDYKISEKSIDVFNSVEGDSNCDGTVGMADAVFIMQSLANPDKYSLTEQGKFNADTNYDGITNLDALSIQKRMLGLM